MSSIEEFEHGKTQMDKVRKMNEKFPETKELTQQTDHEEVMLKDRDSERNKIPEFRTAKGMELKADLEKPAEKAEGKYPAGAGYDQAESLRLKSQYPGMEGSLDRLHGGAGQ